MTVEQTLMRAMKISGGLTHGRGINKEGVIARWIFGMPVAYEVIEGFETFCRVRSASGEQHTDLRTTNINRDTADYLKFVEWLTVDDPFAEIESQKLMSIADGLCGGDEVNCDTTIEIGMKSMKTMVGVNAAEVKMKRTARVKSIATAKHGIVINNEIVAVNTTLLFQRITAVTKNDSDLAITALHHELAPFPLSLFDDRGMMRKSKKSELYNAFTCKPINTINLTQYKTVIDGGFLLHKVVWPLGSTYEQIIKLYEDYVVRNYGRNVIVVFDGYEETNVGIKSYERSKRSKTNMGTEVNFEKEMTVPLTQSKFLSNDKNKHRLIQFIKMQLNSAGIEVEEASEDADRLIIVTAIEQLNFCEKVAIVGQDVDLLVLLIALTPTEKEIYFVKQGSGKIANTLYSTQQHKHLKETILLSHAFTGCDTTSSIFQKEKKSFINILKKKTELLNNVAVFNNPNATRDNIKLASERLMLALCGAKGHETSINNFRYERFVVSATRFKTEVSLAQLPPTAGATEEHGCRVYFQIQQWLGNDQLNPKDWGWELKDQIFFPVMTRIPPAPQSLLEMIYCSCRGNCSNRCGCRKAGRKCSNICSGFHGNSCLTSVKIDISPDVSVSSDDSTDVLLNQFETLICENEDGMLINEEDSESVHFSQNQKKNLDEEQADQPSCSGTKRRRLD